MSANIYSIPPLFHPALDWQLAVESQPLGAEAKWAEFVAHVSQFSEMDIPEAQRVLEQLSNAGLEPAWRAILLTGVARCQIHRGDFIRGPQSLGQAYSLTKTIDRDARAFIILEMVSVLAITGQYPLGIILLERVPYLTQSEYLLHITNYYWAVLNSRSGDLEFLDVLEDSLAYFRSVSEWATVAYHLKNIGNACRKQQNFIAAEHKYQQALDVAIEYRYTHIQSAVLHDMGMMQFHLQNYSAARDLLGQAYNRADSHYTRTFTLGNLGLVCQRAGYSKEGIQYYEKALNQAGQHGLDFLVPSIACNLAEIYEQEIKQDMAQVLYKTGYESAMCLLSQHYPCSGFRKRVIEKYIQSLKLHSNQSLEQFADSDDLSFLDDKTLKQARAHFQSALLSILSDTEMSIQQLCRRLNISRRTYYVAKDRSAEFASDTPPAFLQKFIRENLDQTWKELNSRFDTLVIKHLWERSHHNKKSLSQKLGISYQRTLQLTANISATSLPVPIQEEIRSQS